MSEYKSTITLNGVQIRSAIDLSNLCQALDIIDLNVGVKEMGIIFEDTYVCGDIDFDNFLEYSRRPIEKLIAELLRGEE